MSCSAVGSIFFPLWASASFLPEFCSSYCRRCFDTSAVSEAEYPKLLLLHCSFVVASNCSWTKVGTTKSFAVPVKSMWESMSLFPINILMLLTSLRVEAQILVICFKDWSSWRLSMVLGNRLVWYLSRTEFSHKDVMRVYLEFKSFLKILT